MTPKQAACKHAVERMGVMRYFPSEPAARAEIMRILDAMIETKEQLDWLVTQMIDQVGEWQGPRELRGVFCSRHRPLDGIEASSSHHAFSPEANEGRAIEAHEARKQIGAVPPAEITALAQRKAIQ